MKKKAITPRRSICTGPYSPGIAVGDWVFVSGQGPLDPQTGQVVGDTIEEQTRRTIQNIQAILEEAGCTLADCVKVAVHLSDMNDYDRFNAVYTEYFAQPYPARTLVQSVLLGIRVEIDVIAVRGAGAAHQGS